MKAPLRTIDQKNRKLIKNVLKLFKAFKIIREKFDVVFKIFESSIKDNKALQKNRKLIKKCFLKLSGKLYACFKNIRKFVKIKQLFIRRQNDIKYKITTKFFTKT